MKIKNIDLQDNTKLNTSILSMYDIYLDLENKVLTLNLKLEEEKNDEFNINNASNKLADMNIGLLFVFSKKIDVVYCESETNEKYTLYNVLFSKANPLEFSFAGYLKGCYSDKVDTIENVNIVEYKSLCLDKFDNIKGHYTYNLINFNLEIDIEEYCLNVRALNICNIETKEVRNKLYSVLSFLSLILYYPFVVDTEKYYIKDVNTCYEFKHDRHLLGERKSRIVGEDNLKKLFETIFVEDNINKFLSNLDENYSIFVELFSYIIDKTNNNYSSINDFLIIQILISAEQHYRGSHFGAKTTLRKVFGHKYIKPFVKEEMNQYNSVDYLKKLVDARNCVGHLSVLYESKGTRIPITFIDVSIYEHFKLLLLFPFLLYDYFGMSIKKDLVNEIAEDFENHFSKE